MPITKRVVVHGGTESTLNYICQPSKTEEEILITGIECSPCTASNEMEMTKRQFKKTSTKENDRTAYHVIQSFEIEEENVTKEIAHEIGIALAKELYGDYESVVATHTDKLHLHNHILINSVSFKTGKKLEDRLQNKKEGLYGLRDKSNEICMQYGIGVLENQVISRFKKKKQYRHDKAIEKEQIIRDYKLAISKCSSYEEVVEEMKKNYQFKSDYLIYSQNGSVVKINQLDKGKYKRSMIERYYELKRPKQQGEMLLGYMEIASSSNGIETTFYETLLAQNKYSKEMDKPIHNQQRIAEVQEQIEMCKQMIEQATNSVNDQRTIPLLHKIVEDKIKTQQLLVKLPDEQPIEIVLEEKKEIIKNLEQENRNIEYRYIKDTKVFNKNKRMDKYLKNIQNEKEAIETCIEFSELATKVENGEITNVQKYQNELERYNAAKERLEQMHGTIDIRKLRTLHIQNHQDRVMYNQNYFRIKYEKQSLHHLREYYSEKETEKVSEKELEQSFGNNVEQNSEKVLGDMIKVQLNANNIVREVDDQHVLIKLPYLKKYIQIPKTLLPTDEQNKILIQIGKEITYEIFNEQEQLENKTGNQIQREIEIRKEELENYFNNKKTTSTKPQQFEKFKLTTEVSTEETNDMPSEISKVQDELEIKQE